MELYHILYKKLAENQWVTGVKKKLLYKGHNPIYNWYLEDHPSKWLGTAIYKPWISAIWKRSQNT